MAEIGNSFPTLVDLYKRTDPDGKIATIIELLSEKNAILDDAITVEGNLPTGHTTTIRTGEPTATWRKLNYGVPKGKSTTQQVTDTCGMLEIYDEVDKTLADLNGNTAAWRLSEAKGTMNGMNKQMTAALFYGDTDTDPEKILGFAPRFDVLSTDDTQSGYNIVDGGGTGSDNTSVWFVKWDESTVHLTYPKGSMAGLQHDDKGQQTLQDDAGNNYEGYRSHFHWKIGLVIRDWRAVSRIANIDVSLLNAGSVAIDDFMIDAFYNIADSMGKGAIYCTKAVQVALHKKAKDKANVNLTIDTFEGKEIVKFLGLPIRRCAQLLETEARVV